MDFGGCRCQAFALTGDAANTDPVCTLIPRSRASIDAAIAEAAAPAEYRYRDTRQRAAAGVTSPAPAIEAEGLGRDYGSVRALVALSSRRPAGARWSGLLGPNGAGKTTAMLLLATLLAPPAEPSASSDSTPGLSVPRFAGAWAWYFRRPASTGC